MTIYCVNAQYNYYVDLHVRKSIEKGNYGKNTHLNIQDDHDVYAF